MRKALLATVTILAIGGATAGVMIAGAQPAPPPGPPGMEGPPPHWGRGMMRGGPEGPPGPPGPGMMRNFALVYPQADRKLTPPDVQKIAEAFLLWHGNHTWKVVDVAPTSDGPIAFSIATPEGSVIARFTMDPRTGKLNRTS